MCTKPIRHLGHHCYYILTKIHQIPFNDYGVQNVKSLQRTHIIYRAMTRDLITPLALHNEGQAMRNFEFRKYFRKILMSHVGSKEISAKAFKYR